MSVTNAIRQADRLLPGEDCDEGPSPRWQAVIAVGEFVESDPEPVWEFVKRWGASPIEDLRDAIATCILEHLLEYHFASVFPKVEQQVHANPLFAEMFCRCWKFGQSNHPKNSQQFDALMAWRR